MSFPTKSLRQVFESVGRGPVVRLFFVLAGLLAVAGWYFAARQLVIAREAAATRVAAAIGEDHATRSRSLTSFVLIQSSLADDPITALRSSIPLMAALDPDLVTMAVVDADDEDITVRDESMLAASDHPIVDSARPVLATGEPFVGNVHFESAADAWVVQHAVPVRDRADVVVGAVVVEAPIRIPVSAAGIDLLGSRSHLEVTDAAGRVVASDVSWRVLDPSTELQFADDPGFGWSDPVPVQTSDGRLLVWVYLSPLVWALVAGRAVGLLLLAAFVVTAVRANTRELAREIESPLEEIADFVSSGDRGDARLDRLPITELDAIGQALNRDLDRIEEAKKRDTDRIDALMATQHELDQFAASVAHDLNQPLRGIRGFADVLASTEADCLTPDGRAGLERITAAAERMAERLASIRAFTKTTRLMGRLERLDLTEVVQEVVSELAETVRHDGSISVEPLGEVSGDRASLVRMFHNLLANSLTHRSPEREPEIRVTAERQAEMVVIRVADNGFGIPADQAESVFTPFTTSGSGMGMGLAIVSSIARKHGGSVRVERTGPEGTTMLIELPAPLE